MKAKSTKSSIVNKSAIDTLQNGQVKMQITPIVKASKSTFEVSADFNYKLELIKELSRKYL